MASPIAAAVTLSSHAKRGPCGGQLEAAKGSSHSRLGSLVRKKLKLVNRSYPDVPDLGVQHFHIGK